MNERVLADLIFKMYEAAKEATGDKLHNFDRFCSLHSSEPLVLGSFFWIVLFAVLFFISRRTFMKQPETKYSMTFILFTFINFGWIDIFSNGLKIRVWHFWGGGRQHTLVWQGRQHTLVWPVSFKWNVLFKMMICRIKSFYLFFGSNFSVLCLLN